MTMDTPKPPARNESAVREFTQQARLAWRLFTDQRVPMLVKAIPALAVVYLLWPVDLIPDLPIPIVGQLDDLAVMLLALRLFIELAPPDLVSEHKGQPDTVTTTYRVKDD